VESYQTEEEQLEALQRWWKENGKSTIAAVVVALSGTIGWQSWQANRNEHREQASDIYQAMQRALSMEEGAVVPGQGLDLANQLKSDFSDTSYAQFAALQLAAIAVTDGRLADAEEQLRWVLGKSAKGSDAGQVAQLRLARVLAASGDADQALAILEGAGEGVYAATYAIAEGDILLGAGRDDEAREAYTRALALAAQGGGMVNLPSLQQKIQALSPVPARPLEAIPAEEPGSAAVNGDTGADVPEE